MGSRGAGDADMGEVEEPEVTRVIHREMDHGRVSMPENYDSISGDVNTNVAVLLLQGAECDMDSGHMSACPAHLAAHSSRERYSFTRNGHTRGRAKTGCPLIHVEGRPQEIYGVE